MKERSIRKLQEILKQKASSELPFFFNGVKLISSEEKDDSSLRREIPVSDFQTNRYSIGYKYRKVISKPINFK